MSHIRKLFDHLGWADAQILEALRRSTTKSPRALEIYGHLLAAEHLWLARIEGRPAEMAVWPELTIEEAAVLASANAHAFEGLVPTLSEDGLARLVHYRTSAGSEFDSRVDDILLHVAMHGQYHRGQVNVLLRDTGAQPASVDFIAFMRGAPAATRRT